jgi:endonuclease YncB( thermonuclease family)
MYSKVFKLFWTLALLIPMLAIGECRHQQDTHSLNDATWTVQKVHDGDTVTVVDKNGHAEKIRLADIDAPEYRQPYGQIARDALAQKLDQGLFQVKSRGRDQYDRLLATLWVDGRNINRELVAEGLAWVFDRYSPPADLLTAQEQAKKAQIGLWEASNPIRPSTWRATHPRQ